MSAVAVASRPRRSESGRQVIAAAWSPRSAAGWTGRQAGVSGYAVRPRRLRARRQRSPSSIPHGATLPAERRQGGRRRDGLDWWPAKGPRRPPGPGPPRTLLARSSTRLPSAPAQDDVEGPATDSTPGLDPRACARGDPDTFGRCGHRDHLPDHRDASLARGPLLPGEVPERAYRSSMAEVTGLARGGSCALLLLLCHLPCWHHPHRGIRCECPVHAGRNDVAGTSTPYKRPGQRPPDGIASHHSHSDHSAHARPRGQARADPRKARKLRRQSR